MDWSNLPEWLKVLGGAALGALGMFGVAIIRAYSDNGRTRSDDRVQFTSQVLERVRILEEHISQEREFCREEIRRVQEQSNLRIESRDRIISELRERITHLENLLGSGTP